MSGSPRKGNGICTRCANAPRIEGYSYCRECRKQMQRDRYTRLAASKRRDRVNPHACNCGNPTCSGLTCERVSL